MTPAKAETTGCAGREGPRLHVKTPGRVKREHLSTSTWLAEQGVGGSNGGIAASCPTYFSCYNRLAVISDPFKQKFFMGHFRPRAQRQFQDTHKNRKANMEARRQYINAHRSMQPHAQARRGCPVKVAPTVRQLQESRDVAPGQVGPLVGERPVLTPDCTGTGRIRTIANGCVKAELHKETRWFLRRRCKR